MTDWSFYLTTPDTEIAYTLGCNQGAFGRQLFASRQQSGRARDRRTTSRWSGSLLTNGVAVSNAQIEAVVEAFSAGYSVCAGSDTTSVTMIEVGTNNSYFDVNFSGGSTWAQVVAAIIASNQANGYHAQISTLTSDQAWNALWNDLNSHSETAEDMTYSGQSHAE